MKLQRPVLAILFLLSTSLLLGQDVKEAARKERERQAALKQKSHVYTNADVATQRPPEDQKKSSDAATPAGGEQKILDNDGHDEKYWSEKFIAAKKRLAATEQEQVDLEARLKDYTFKLETQSNVYDREHLYIPLIEEAKQEREKNKKELEDAKTALDNLYTALRKSGGPRVWADSKLAEQAAPSPDHPDPEYFQKQLKKVDEEYEALERPYKAERFRLINRRNPDKTDNLNMKAENYGPGLDPGIATLDAKINELEEKRLQASAEVIRQARRARIEIQ